MAQDTVYHPRFASVTRTGLTEAQRQAHKDAGWRLTPIPADHAGDEPGSPAPSGRLDAIETVDATSSE